MNYQSKTISILGVNISVISKDKALEQIKVYLKDNQTCYIVTPNPEIVLSARHDEEYFHILNKADLSLPDGVGLKFAALALGTILPRTTGADITRDILAMAEEKQLKVAVINWRQGLSTRAEITAAIHKLHPRLELLVLDIERSLTLPDYREINKFMPDIVFAALGAPWQEKFIYHNLAKMPYAKVAIGVGGAFDFIAGKIKRAPKWLRVVGLEWLWRLKKQPRRWRRIYTAIIVFPVKFIKWRFFLPWLYRSNVACLLYKKEDDKYKILILERGDLPGHWQLPQGGTDSLNIWDAGIKELSEEIKSRKFKPIKAFPILYKYKFGERDQESRIYAASARKHTGYKGQKQGLLIAEYFGDDSDIKVNFWDHAAWKWAASQELVASVHPVRREAAKIFLDKFNEVNKS